MTTILVVLLLIFLYFLPSFIPPNTDPPPETPYIASVNINTESSTIQVDELISLYAEAKDNLGTSMVSGVSFVWVTNNPSGLNLLSTTGQSISVKGIIAGQYEINITATAGIKTVNDSITITVQNPPPPQDYMVFGNGQFGTGIGYYWVAPQERTQDPGISGPYFVYEGNTGSTAAQFFYFYATPSVNMSQCHVKLKFKIQLSYSCYIGLHIQDAEANTVNINLDDYGYNRFSTGVFQQIIIPLNNETFHGLDFNHMERLFQIGPAGSPDGPSQYFIWINDVYWTVS